MRTVKRNQESVLGSWTGISRILGREVSCVFAVGFTSQEVIQSPAFTRDAQAVEQAGQSTLLDERLSVQSSQRTRRRKPSVYRQVLGIQLAVRGWDHQVLVNCAEVSRYIKPCGRSTDEKKVVVAVAQILALPLPLAAAVLISFNPNIIPIQRQKRPIHSIPKFHSKFQFEPCHTALSDPPGDEGTRQKANPSIEHRRSPAR